MIALPIAVGFVALVAFYGWAGAAAGVLLVAALAAMTKK